jgi:hypothetical protein
VQTVDLHSSDQIPRAGRFIAVTFGIMAVVATAFVWAGLSLTDLLSVVRRH